MPALTARRFAFGAFVWAGSLLLVHETRAQSPSPTDPFKDKAAAFATEIDREVKDGTIQDNNETKSLRAHLRSIQNFHQTGIDPHGMEFHIHGLCEHAGRVSPDLARACGELLESVQHTHQEAAAQRSQATSAFLQETAQAIRSAKKASDLNAILARLEQATNIPGNQYVEDLNGLTKLREAKDVVETWQRALKDFENGDLSSASNKVPSASNHAQSAFGSALPSSFFDDTFAAWAAYWRSYIENALAQAKRDLAAAKTPAEAMRVNDAVTALQRFQSNERFLGNDVPRRIGNAGSISRDWADLLRAEADGNYRNELSILERLKNSARDEGSLMTPAEIDTKRGAVYAAVVRKLQSMLDDAGKQLTSARTPEEVQLIENRFNEYHEVIDRQSNDYADLILKIGQLRRVAQAWKGVVAAQNNQDSDAMARSLAELTRANAGANPFIPAAVVEEKRKIAGSLAPDGGTGPDAAWFANLPNRITAINKSEDIATLNAEVRTHATALPSGGGTFRDEIYRLQNDLSATSTFAAACEQGRFNFSLVPGSFEATNHRWQKQTAEVRARFARQALAKQLGVPELMQAPLDLAALETTVLQLADQEAKKKEWRKVYDLLLACAGSEARLAPGRSHINEELLGIADFFTGQRLEKAQQWPEAIRAYQNVLRRMGDRLPVDEATARLQALTKEHPEAATQVATQPQFPTRR